MENTITVTRKINVEQVLKFEIPLYFKYLQNYYMVLNPSMALIVKNFGNEAYNALDLYPSIQQDKLSDYVLSKSGEFETITEEQFKEVFTKVSLELEALMN